MSLKQWWKTGCATVALTAMISQPVLAATGATDELSTSDLVAAVKASPSLQSTVQRFLNSSAVPASDHALLQRYASDPSVGPTLQHLVKEALIRLRVKHVFIIFQENRAFDHYFGTFPGADGLFNARGQRTGLGSTQAIVNTDGSVSSISPFLIPQTVKNTAGQIVPLYPADLDESDHSETGIDNSLDVNGSTLLAMNDRYALDQEGLTTTKGGKIVSLSTGLPPTTNPTLSAKQAGEVALSHVDCNTIPILWKYAHDFSLFDNFHQTVIGPSTPNAIALIAGQSGMTQWALHPGDAHSSSLPSGVPVVADPGPFAGSNKDPSAIKPPYNPDDESPATPAIDQTYASLPLSFMGNQISTIIKADQNPTVDLADVQQDIQTIAGENLPPTNWAWYQLGYDNEPLDPTNNTPTNPHNDYIVHHEGPQYFGYIGDNTTEQKHLFGQGAFYTALATGALPSSGVFYIRGGYGNLSNLTPVDPNPNLAVSFAGNDDHPGYSDAQISEASVADTVNAIAKSPYWKDSAIIITYDETDGLYDHHQVNIRAKDPSGNYLEAGPRIPTIVISPWGVSGKIVHQYSEHSSVIKFVDELFGLTPLADLPNEQTGRADGQQEFGQQYLTPADDVVPGIGDLFPAFDDLRLLGLEAPVKRSVATIPTQIVDTLPQYGGQGCSALGITPTDFKSNGTVIDPPPADFNPRPSDTPGIPTQPGWTP